MKIGIDAHGVGGHSLGPGNETYFQNLIGALLDLDGSNEYHVFVNHPEAMAETVRGHANARLVSLWPRSQWIQRPLSLPLYATTHGLDLVHVPFIQPMPLRARTVLTVHDANFELFPDDFTRLTRWRLKTFVPWSIRLADLVFTVSEFGRANLERIYDLPPGKVVVTYNAPDHRASVDQETGRTLEGLGIRPPFVLFVGALQPKKNLARLVRAFDAVVDRCGLPHQLVLAGKWGWGNVDLEAALAETRHRDRIRLTGYLTDEEVVRCMRAAEVFAFPSLYECFGIPPMEAQRLGTPCLVANTTCFPEIYRDSALACDPHSVESVSVALESLLLDPALRRTLTERGLRRSADFAWARTARIALAAYHRVCGLPEPALRGMEASCVR
ncbi:MAG: glycosyltransferase family 1 protein [Vicinamibacterales bacterium]